MATNLRPIRWGVIGCGGIAARRTIPEFKSMVHDAELVSVMDVSPERARAVAETFGVPHHCVTERELLAQDLDAVYIATPQDAHCRQAVQAAMAGKHILCEKPIAISIEEVEQIEKACKHAGAHFMLGFCMRNHVYHRKARELVQSGALGQPVMARAELTCWYPPIPGAWRQDVAISRGGALIDMGTHCLDLLEWVLGARIIEVTGFQDRMTHAYPTMIEDASTIVLRFSNGAHGIVDNYFNLPDAAAQNTLEIHGTLGSIVAQGTIGQEPTGRMFSILQAEALGYDAQQARPPLAERLEYTLEPRGLYGQMIMDFNDCIRERRRPPITIDDGRHSVQVVEAIYRAVRERRVACVEAED